MIIFLLSFLYIQVSEFIIYDILLKKLRHKKISYTYKNGKFKKH